MDITEYFDLKIIDNLKELGGGDDSFLKEVMNLYLEQAPGLLNDIRKYAAASNAEEMSKSAHCLKGASLNIGANKFAEVCKKIEMAGKENNLAGIDALIKEMDECYNYTKELIGNFI
jgi:HPt (histidine-containing phosphotransfer) domain-containing protein